MASKIGIRISTKGELLGELNIPVEVEFDRANFNDAATLNLILYYITTNIEEKIEGLRKEKDAS